MHNEGDWTKIFHIMNIAVKMAYFLVNEEYEIIESSVFDFYTTRRGKLILRGIRKSQLVIELVPCVTVTLGCGLGSCDSRTMTNFGRKVYSEKNLMNETERLH